MKFSIGDKILLTRTEEEGVVTAILNNDMFEVQVNGVVFPVHKDDIDHPYLKWFTEKKKQPSQNKTAEQLPVEKTKQRPQRFTKGIYLCFFPVFKKDVFEDIVDYLKIYLINETPHDIQIKYETRIQHEPVFQHQGMVFSFSDIYLHNVPFEDMNDVPRFHWQLISKDAGFKTEEGILKIKPQKLFDHISQLLLKNEPSFNYLLLEDFIVKPEEEAKKETFIHPLPKVQRISSKSFSLQELPRYELDLHIEQIIADSKNLSNAEIITLQLQTLERYLSLAILHHQERMIIIHGVGKGKLRNEVHRILKNIPEVKHFKNEWMGNYGFGATEVLFEYS